MAVLGLLTTVLLGGCVLRVVYQQLDWLTLRYVNGYLDLTAAQKASARTAIDRGLDWHRETQLPRWLAIVDELLAQVDKPVSTRFVACEYQSIANLLDDSLQRAGPDLVALLRDLSDAQVMHLSARLQKDNEAMARKYAGATPGERRRNQDKALMRLFRRYLGRLDPVQEAAIRRHTAGFADLSAEWLQRRMRWQDELQRVLAERATDPAFPARVMSLLLDPNQFDSPGYRERVAETRASAFAMVAEVLNGLSVKQVRHLRERLTTDAADLEALMGKDKAGRDQTSRDVANPTGCGAEERT